MILRSVVERISSGEMKEDEFYLPGQILQHKKDFKVIW